MNPLAPLEYTDERFEFCEHCEREQLFFSIGRTQRTVRTGGIICSVGLADEEDWLNNVANS